MNIKRMTLAGIAVMALLSSSVFAKTTITVATVNNGDMIRMQGLMDDFNDKNPDINVEWVTLEENLLRSKVTTDIATNGGQYDVMTIGTYEVPIWAKKGWLKPLNFDASYDVDDLLPAMRNGLSYDGQLYAAPFYGESSMVMYRKDLMRKAGMTMPEAPNWRDIEKAAQAMTDKRAGVYGICLRGKPGWGENMAFLTAMANSFGARWFDEDWNAQFDSAEWEDAINTYLRMMTKYGPPGAASNGFNENLTLFQQGKCGMWIDATVAASFVTNPKDSKVADKVGFALAPDKGYGKRGNWLWAWSLAIPGGTKKADAAKTFIEWATSKEYLELVASKEGWANVPPGTRTSLYENREYAKVPFAEMTLKSINEADPTNPTVDPVPYVGVQFVAIEEFASIGTSVGQEFSAALAGKKTAEQALRRAQRITDREMRRAGYK